MLLISIFHLGEQKKKQLASYKTYNTFGHFQHPMVEKNIFFRTLVHLALGNTMMIP
jgi:hypothetical protein